MKDYKAAWRYYFFLIFFSLVSVLGARVIWMLLNGEVMEGDEEMSRGMAIFLSVVVGIAFSTYIETALVLAWQLIHFDRCGLEITENGVENTVVFINVLAFVIVAPVKLIPWEAVKYADFDDEHPYIRVNTKVVQAGWFAKLMLFVLGYHFCLSFVKPKVTIADVKRYEHRFSVPSE